MTDTQRSGDIYANTVWGHSLDANADKMSPPPAADDLTKLRGRVDFSKKLPTIEDAAADYKQRVTVHLKAVKKLMDEAEADGFQVSFNVGFGVTVTISKTF